MGHRYAGDGPEVARKAHTDGAVVVKLCDVGCVWPSVNALTVRRRQLSARVIDGGRVPEHPQRSSGQEQVSDWLPHLLLNLPAEWAVGAQLVMWGEVVDPIVVWCWWHDYRSPRSCRTGCERRAPQSHTIHTKPSATPASSMPHRRCSARKASRAWRMGVIGSRNVSRDGATPQVYSVHC